MGIPTVFVRLTGCPLRCQYCDTAYAFDGGELMELDTIKAVLEEVGCGYVTVTGVQVLWRASTSSTVCLQTPALVINLLSQISQRTHSLKST